MLKVIMSLFDMFISLLLIITYNRLCNDNVKLRDMIYNYVLYVEFVLVTCYMN